MRGITLQKLFSAIFTLLCYCTLLTSKSTNANAADNPLLKTGVSFAIPPWVIQETNSGIELDILRSALRHYAIEIEPVFIPFARAFPLFDSNELDIVLNAKPGSVRSGFYSDPVVQFENVAISLKKKNFSQDTTIADLVDKRVVAFQNASKFLGREFQEMAEKNNLYDEVAKQKIQINLLFLRGKIDFIIMDKSIFGYYWSEAIEELKSNGEDTSSLLQPVQFHNLFPKTSYPFVFQDEDIKNKFNEGLRKLHASGDYALIIEKYTPVLDLYPRSPTLE